MRIISSRAGLAKHIGYLAPVIILSVVVLGKYLIYENFNAAKQEPQQKMYTEVDMQLASIKDQLEGTRAELNRTKEINDALKTQMSGLSERLDNVKNENQELKKGIGVIQHEAPGLLLDVSQGAKFVQKADMSQPFNEELDNLTQSLAFVSSLNETLKKQFAELTQELEMTTVELTKTKSENKMLTDKVFKLTKILNDQRQENLKVKQEIGQTQLQNVALEEKINKLQLALKEASSEKMQMSQMIETLASDNKSLLANLKIAKAKLEETAGERKSILQQIRDLAKKNSSLNGELGSIENNEAVVNKNVKELDEQLASLVREKEELEKAISDINVSISMLGNPDADTTLKQVDMKTQLAELNQTIEKLLKEKGAFTARLNTIAAEKDEIKASMGAILEENKRLSQAYNEADAKYAALKAEKEAVNRKLADFQQEISTSEKILGKRANQVLVLTDQLERTKAEKSVVTSQINALSLQLEKSRSDTVALENSLARLAKSLEEKTQEAVGTRLQLDEVKMENADIKQKLLTAREYQKRINAELSKVMGVNASLQEQLMGMTKPFVPTTSSTSAAITQPIYTGTVDADERMAAQAAEAEVRALLEKVGYQK